MHIPFCPYHFVRISFYVPYHFVLEPCGLPAVLIKDNVNNIFTYLNVNKKYCTLQCSDYLADSPNQLPSILFAANVAAVAGEGAEGEDNS